MSELPRIDPAKLAQKLLDKNSELTYQVAQLEVLAEALRDERDALHHELGNVRDQLPQINEPVADISSLPPK